MLRSSCGWLCNYWFQPEYCKGGHFGRLQRSFRLHKAILRTELDPRCVCFMTALQHGPAIEELRPNIERAIWIPDQIPTGVRGMVVGCTCCEIGIINASV